MDPNEAVASEAAAPAAGQESVGVGPSGHDGLHLGHLPARLLQEYGLTRYQSPRRRSRQKSRRVPSWLHPARGVLRWRNRVQKFPLSPVVATSRAGEHRGSRIPYKNKRSVPCVVPGSRTNENISVPWLPDPVRKITPLQLETRFWGQSYLGLVEGGVRGL